MTKDQLTQMEVVFAELEARGVHFQRSIHSSTSNGKPWYAWMVKSARLKGDTPIAIHTPHTAEELLELESRLYARQQHGAAIYSVYEQSQDRLIADLAEVYRLQLLGKDIPVPEQLSVMIDIDLRVMSAPPNLSVS